ncbi:hypothetical protein NUW54_g14656 [Trametes sanguinea]|uniref:Uncharacterized protein n=1 Tax=Trametes sanguinea TaxID=158606 RepID=A0ACC1MBK1_9APHY|nr:hypothetical protein NUW54_g14656 [Trametes sanguinea]
MHSSGFALALISGSGTDFALASPNEADRSFHTVAHRADGFADSARTYAPPPLQHFTYAHTLVRHPRISDSTAKTPPADPSRGHVRSSDRHQPISLAKLVRLTWAMRSVLMLCASEPTSSPHRTPWPGLQAGHPPGTDASCSARRTPTQREAVNDVGA